MTAP
jgi:hypothetical protein